MMAHSFENFEFTPVFNLIMKDKQEKNVRKFVQQNGNDIAQISFAVQLVHYAPWDTQIAPGIADEMNALAAEWQALVIYSGSELTVIQQPKQTHFTATLTGNKFDSALNGSVVEWDVPTLPVEGLETQVAHGNFLYYGKLLKDLLKGFYELMGKLYPITCPPNLSDIGRYINYGVPYGAAPAGELFLGFRFYLSKPSSVLTFLIYAFGGDIIDFGGNILSVTHLVRDDAEDAGDGPPRVIVVLDPVTTKAITPQWCREIRCVKAELQNKFLNI